LLLENKSNSQKVGLFGLIMIVIGSMIGSGIFNLPQDIASNAGVGASIIAWIITGIGVFL
jgi:arginine:ornithine antiporter / lysine permease